MKTGRPKIEFSEKDANEIIHMAKIGLTISDIADIKQTSISSITRNFKDKMKKARKTGIGKVYETAFNLATSGKCPAMTMFYLKTRAGWREKERVDIHVTEEKKKKPKKRDKLPLDANKASKIYREFMRGEKK
jgi:hypothetical protein